MSCWNVGTQQRGSCPPPYRRLSKCRTALSPFNFALTYTITSRGNLLRRIKRSFHSAVRSRSVSKSIQSEPAMDMATRSEELVNKATQGEQSMDESIQSKRAMEDVALEIHILLRFHETSIVERHRLRLAGDATCADKPMLLNLLGELSGYTNLKLVI